MAEKFNPPKAKSTEHPRRLVSPISNLMRYSNWRYFHGHNFTTAAFSES